MNVLLPKSKGDIIESFKNRYRISDGDMEKLIKTIKGFLISVSFENIRSNRFILLLWAVPSFLLGATGIVTMISIPTSDNKIKFPLIYEVAQTYWERFTNIFCGVAVIAFFIFLIIFSIRSVAQEYDW